MARQLSGHQENLKVGISSFSEDKTSLQVIGKVGIGTADAMQPLHVEGNAYISGSIGIGNSQTISPGVGNTSVIAVGIVTANEIYGELKDVTGIAQSARNIVGGADGKLVIQSDVGVTSFFEYGNTGFALVSRGDGNPPQWAAAAPAGAIEGLLLFEEGSLVGGGNSYGGLDFRGSAITVVGAGTPANIGTITVSGNFDEGMTIQNGLTVSGLSTFSSDIRVSGFVTAAPGAAVTYFGDGSNLTGITAGFWESTDVGINTLSNVGIGTTNPTVALDVHGDVNVTGDITVGGNAIPSIAMIVALGGF